MATPAREVRSYTVTIPAGTLASAPYTESVSFPPRVVEAVAWRVPPGPSGLMSWQLTMDGGVAVIPTGGGYITADNQAAEWTLYDQPDSGAWEVTGYNTDIYDHSIYIDFLLSPVSQPSSPAVLPSSASLSSPAGVAAAGVSAG